MTTPGGGHGNDINLAALWIPVMPETSHMGEEMRKVGAESKRQFEQGFNSGASPESMGQSFGSKLAGSINNEFRHFELPYGMSGFLDKFSGDVDEKVVKKLRGEASQALQQYRTEWDNLAQAQGRAAEAETRLSTAREGGFNKASIMLPLISEQTKAQTNLTEAHTKATGALDNYNTANGKLTSELSKAADGGKIMAGIMGGAIVLGAQFAAHAVENLVEAVAEGFTKSIELTVELGKAAVELGEKYEHIGIQIHEFSTTSGEDFAKTEEAAQHVFSTLDVAGNDVGKTMAQLSSILGVSGEEIQSLVKDVTELQGRYTTLKATDLGSSFLAFKVPAEEADKALASLLQSARGSGQDLGQLASTLSGNVAITLHEAGLNIEQAGKFTAELMAMGEPGRQAMTGMAMAMKDFGKEGLSFADGMREAGQQLNALGDTAAGQDLAEKLFGGRNWIVAKDAVAKYLEIINQAPDAFAATTASTQEFLDQTENLGNKIEEFKHQAEEAFKPFGDAAKNAALSGLNSLSNWFTLHHHEIIGKIRDWGNKLIDLLPMIQSFTADAIRLGGDFATGLLMMFGPVAQTLAAAGAGMLALTGHFKDAKDLLLMVNNFDPGKIKEATDKIADNIQNFKYDSEALHDSWNGIADAADRTSTTVGTGLTQGLPTPGAPGAPGGFPQPGPTGSFGLGGPGAPWFGPGSNTVNTGPGGAPPTGPGGHHADWDAIAQNESSGVWNEVLKTGVIYGGGLQIKPDTWYEFGGLAFAQMPYQASKEDQIKVAERILNGWGSRPGQGPGAWENGKTYVERKQHGGPAGDGMDMVKPRGRYGPVVPYGGNINPAMRIDLSRIVPAKPYHPFDWEQYKGMVGAPSMGMATGGPSGTDTVPALLTPGEYVWDTKTMDKWGWLISAIHQGGAFGFDQGGGVLQVIYSNTATGQKTGEAGGAYVGPGTSQPGYYGKDWEGHTGHVHTSFATSPYGDFYGLPKGTDIRQGQSGFPAWVYAVGAAFGVEASTYAGHQEGSGYNRGIDWWPKGHADMSGSSYTPEEKQRLQNFASSIAGYGVASSQAGSPSAWAATAPLSSGPTGGDYGPSQQQYPGMPGQYGGYGVYGGETADQQAQLAKSVREAQERKADLDQQIIRNQRAVDDLKDQIAHVADPTKHGALGHPIALTPDELAAADDKRVKLNQQLDDATAALAKSQREAGDANIDIADATRKQTEGTYKKPGGTQQLHATGEAAFQQLGASFLSGIGQELGFGDLFSKPPWEWGAVKLLTGVAGWAMGTANAWSDALMNGTAGSGGGGSGGSGLSALLSGATGSLGIPLPAANVSSGPNIVPVQPGTTQHGAGQGQPPGPVVQGDYMPINVSPNVDPSAILGPVQEQRNKDASQANTYIGNVHP